MPIKAKRKARNPKRRQEGEDEAIGAALRTMAQLPSAEWRGHFCALAHDIQDALRVILSFTNDVGYSQLLMELAVALIPAPADFAKYNSDVERMSEDTKKAVFDNLEKITEARGVHTDSTIASIRECFWIGVAILYCDLDEMFLLTVKNTPYLERPDTQKHVIEMCIRERSKKRAV